MAQDDLAVALAQVERRLASVERHTRLAFGSADGTRVVYDEEGKPRQYIGRLPDGSFGVITRDAPPPPMPSPPTVEGGLGALLVTWDGQTHDFTNWPSDFSHVEVHVSTTQGFTPTDYTIAGSIFNVKGDTIPVAGLESGIVHYVRLIAVNTSSSESPATEEVQGVPDAAVTQAELDAIEADVAAAQQAAADAEQAAADAQEAVETTANGKNKVYFEPVEPTPPEGGFTDDDLWWDTDDGYKPYRWDSTANSGAGGWVGYTFGSGALSDGSVTDSKLSSSVSTAITDAQQTADDAASAAATAQAAAEAAQQDALDAAGLAESKGKVWFQTTAPPGNENDLWIDTTNDENTPKRWNGSAWVEVTDKTALDAADAAAAAQSDATAAAQAAAAAQSDADAAAQAAAAAQSAADDAQATADGKIVTYYQATKPALATSTVGDLWIDTDNEKQLYRFNGTDYTLVADSRISEALADAAAAQSTADGKVVTFVEPSTAPPTAEGVGDVWIVTDLDNLLRRWNGTAWVDLAIGSGALEDGSVTSGKIADGAIQESHMGFTIESGGVKITYGTAGHADPSVDDLWYDTADGYKPYRWDGDSWAPVPFGPGALADGAITDTKLSSGVSSSITGAQDTADQAAQDAADAYAEALSRIPTRAAYRTSSTGATLAGHWTKIAMSRVTGRYASVDFDVLLTGTASGDASSRWATIHCRLKQQAAFGEAPHASLHYTGGAWFQPEDFIGIVTVNDSAASGGTDETVIEWWLRVNGTYEQPGFTPMNVHGGGVHDDPVFYDVQPLVAEGSLPPGTQVAATDVSHHPTTNRVDGWTYTGTTEIDGGAVRADTVTAAQIAAGTITAAELAADSIIAGKIAAGAVVAGTIAADAVTANEIAADSIIASHIATGEIVAGHLAAGAVTAGTVAADAIAASNIAADAVLASHINAGAINAGHIAAGEVNATHIAADQVQAQHVAARNIDGVHIAGYTITAYNISANAITAAKIDANAVTASKITAGAVTTYHLDSYSITADKIDTNAITSSKISATAIDGMYITGPTIYVPGPYGDSMKLYATSNNSRLEFYDPNYYYPGSISGYGTNGIRIEGPRDTSSASCWLAVRNDRINITGIQELTIGGTFTCDGIVNHANIGMNGGDIYNVGLLGAGRVQLTRGAMDRVVADTVTVSTDSNGYCDIYVALDRTPRACIAVPASHFGNPTTIVWDQGASSGSRLTFRLYDSNLNPLPTAARTLSYWAVYF